MAEVIGLHVQSLWAHGEPVPLPSSTTSLIDAAI